MTCVRFGRLADLMTLAEAFLEACVAAGAAVVADGLVEGARSGEDPHVAFCAGNGGVD